LAHDPQYQGAPSHETVQNILNKFGVNMKDVIKKFGHFNVDPIIVDEQLKDGDMIGSLQVIHTPGHTPGHISLYSKKHKIMFGADSLFKSVLGMDDLFILPEVVIDPITAAISVRRISQIKFDKLLLAHQDSPILEGGQKAVEKVTYAALNSRSFTIRLLQFKELEYFVLSIILDSKLVLYCSDIIIEVQNNNSRVTIFNLYSVAGIIGSVFTFSIVSGVFYINKTIRSINYYNR